MPAHGLLRERDELLEAAPPHAPESIASRAGPSMPSLLEVGRAGRPPRSRPAGVQEHRLQRCPPAVRDRRAPRAALAAFVCRVAAPQLGRVAARPTPSSAGSRARTRAAHRRRRSTSQTRFGPAGDSLVDPARETVHDVGAVRVELHERLGDRPHQPGRVHADELRPCPGRVRERAEHVEDRPCGELLPHRPRMPHRRVVRLREPMNPEANGFVDRLRDPGRASSSSSGSRAPPARPPHPSPTRPRGCRASRRPRRQPRPPARPRSRC